MAFNPLALDRSTSVLPVHIQWCCFLTSSLVWNWHGSWYHPVIASAGSLRRPSFCFCSTLLVSNSAHRWGQIQRSFPFTSALSSRRLHSFEFCFNSSRRTVVGHQLRWQWLTWRLAAQNCGNNTETIRIFQCNNSPANLPKRQAQDGNDPCQIRKPWRYQHSEELQIQLWQGRVCSAQGCIQVLLCSLTCGCQLPSWCFFFLCLLYSISTNWN